VETGGAGPLITASARLLAEMVRAQERLDHPLADDFARLDRPNARMLVGVSETMRRIAIGRRALRALLLANRLAGRTVPAAAA
jgi:hypothetical protein